MPFTVSHALAVLPLATGRPARRLIPAALVIGSWTPDLQYFFPGPRWAVWSHAASGPVTIDLVVGLAVFVVWRAVLQRPVHDLAPVGLRVRLPAPRGLEVRRTPWIVVSMVIGAGTHVIWDSFTHHDRWGTDHLALLDAVVGGLPLYKWAQYLSGMLGVVVLAGWAVRWYRRTRPVLRADRPGDPLRTVSALVVLLASAAAGWVDVRAQGRADLETLAYHLVTASMGAATMALVGCCLVWHGRDILERWTHRGSTKDSERSPTRSPRSSTDRVRTPPR